MNLTRILPLLALSLLFSGCIQSEESRSFYLSGDGKVDMIIHYDNLRSGDAGSKATDEEKKWLADFKGGRTSEQTGLVKAKARGVRAVVLREQTPFAAVLRAGFDSVDAFGRFFDLNRPDGDGTVKLEKDGKIRRLVFHIEQKGDAAAKRAAKDKAAKGEAKSEPNYPVWKFIPVGGKVTESKICIPGAGRLSCTLDFREFEKLDQGSPSFEFTIAWELN